MKNRPVLKELRPIFIASRLLALLPTTLPTNRKAIGRCGKFPLFYSIFALLCFSVPLTIAFPHFWKYRMDTASTAPERMKVIMSLSWTFVPCMFSAIVMALFICKRHQLRIALLKVHRIQSAPIPRMTSRSKNTSRSSFLQVAMLTIMFSGTTFVHFRTYGNEFERAIFDLYIPLYGFLVSIVLDLQFTNLLLVLKRKISTINSVISGLAKLGSKKPFFKSESYRNRRCLIYAHILKLAELHLRICRIAASLNLVYGPSVLVHTIVTLIELAFQFFNFLVGIQLGTDLWLRAITGLFWSCPFVAVFIAVLTVCEKTRQEAENTCKLVTELYLASDEKKIRCMLSMFLDQLQHTKLHFTACKFFTLDLQLLLAIISGVVSHLAILLQFHLLQEDV